MGESIYRVLEVLKPRICLVEGQFVGCTREDIEGSQEGLYISHGRAAAGYVQAEARAKKQSVAKIRWGGAKPRYHICHQEQSVDSTTRKKRKLKQNRGSHTEANGEQRRDIHGKRAWGVF